LQHINTKIESQLALYEIYLKKNRALPVVLVSTSNHPGSLDILISADVTLTTKQLYEIMRTVNKVLLARVMANG